MTQKEYVDIEHEYIDAVSKLYEKARWLPFKTTVNALSEQKVLVLDAFHRLSLMEVAMKEKNFESTSANTGRVESAKG